MNIYEGHCDKIVFLESNALSLITAAQFLTSKNAYHPIIIFSKNKIFRLTMRLNYSIIILCKHRYLKDYLKYGS